MVLLEVVVVLLPLILLTEVCAVPGTRKSVNVSSGDGTLVTVMVVRAMVLLEVVVVLLPLILLTEVCEETVLLPVISNTIPIS